MGSMHPFYVSVTEVEYKSGSKEIGVVCKVFPDDMEETLRLFTQKKFDISRHDDKEIKTSLDAYFKKHLSIKVNGKPRNIVFLGYENNKESTYIYFNVPNISNVKSIELVTNLMYEYHSEQANIIHLSIDNKRESFKLTAPETRASILK
ncbi:MAG: DUF6702 family protein [bacterium]